MPVIDITEIPALGLTDKNIIGLDLGTKTIGIAISDLGWRFATPRPVLKRKKFSIDAEQLVKIFSEENIGVAIIGLPKNMDGTSGPRVQATRAFVHNMNSFTEIPFVFWDERLSTVAAERGLLEMDVSRAKRADRIDSAAAAFILQGALDRLNRLAQTAG
ncbi:MULTISPECIES: Holliday junction resolvase RuvX [Bartonella]|uniref:Putative pre-16S rRNA nuclease n=1 Tax=Bartonella choladocola TaxID=2750995 RepID=A0A1U9MI53_9HYPH|nr:Holliday junction resolvase RuvX [Bartonella choladocola]AQT47399.1 putative holliday junction resolvase [Bartonella choladocola]MBI0140751.1 Holliday junction resolvase RuvX [Bartonella choladocola]